MGAGRTAVYTRCRQAARGWARFSMGKKETDMRTILLIGAAALAASCATGGERTERVNKAAAETLAKYEPTGEKERCISTSRIDQMTAVDEKTLLFRLGVNDYYVNKVRGRCNGATFSSNRFQYKVTGSQLCSIDIIDVVDTSGFTTGACSLGEFEELALKQEPAE